MKMSRRILALLLHLPVVAVLIAASVAAPAARADNIHCTVIAATPYRITAPGMYCLGGNILHQGAANAPAITVAAHFVSLDCNGYSITNQNAADQGSAVSAAGFNDLQVRNCTFGDFYRGIVLSQVKRGRIENTLVLRAKSTGINATGENPVLLNNRLIDATCMAIYIAPSAGSVGIASGNIVRGVGCATTAVPTGMVIAGAGRVIATGNHFQYLGNTGATNTAYGILVSSSSSLLVPSVIEDNRFFGMRSSKNMAVAKAGTTQKSRCSGNLTPGTWIANTGCL
jgi:hypothetical protein